MSRKQPFDNDDLARSRHAMTENLMHTAGTHGGRIKSITICAIFEGADGQARGWNMKSGCTCPDCLMRTMESVATAFGAKIKADGGGDCAADIQGQVH